MQTIYPDATTAPGANTNTTNLFNSTTAFPGKRMAQYAGNRKLCLDLKNSAVGTLKFYKSVDRGTNWIQVDEKIVAVVTPESNRFEFLIENYDDFKLDWVNGGSAQSPWSVSISLEPQRSAA